MLKDGLRAVLLTTPVILASLGCSSGRQFTQARQPGSPHDHQIAVAQSYERNGEFEKAKQIYEQILAKDPNSVATRRRLDALVMAERRLHAVAERDQHLQPSGPTLAESTGVAPAPPRTSTVLNTTESEIRGARTYEVASQVRRSPTSSDANRGIQQLQTAGLNQATEVGSGVVRNVIPTGAGDEFELPAKPETPEAVADSLDPKATDTLDGSDGFQSPIVRRTQPLDTSDFGSNSNADDSTDGRIETDGTESMADRQRQQILDYLSADDDEANQQAAEQMLRDVQASKREPIDPTLFGEFSLKMVDIVKASPDTIQPTLIRVLVDPSVESCHRARAAFLLGTLGSKAESSLPVLRQVIKDSPDAILRIDLALAILEIRPNDERSIRLVLNALQDPDPQVQWWAAFSLRKCAGPSTADAIPTLIEVLKTSDLRLKRMIFLTLAAYGSAASDAIPEMESALEGDDQDTKTVAEAALASIRQP